MSELNFIKMEGLGNDYIYVITEQNPSLDLDALLLAVPSLSNRNNGIGSDGLILVGRDGTDIWCRIFNADSSEAETCGNGLRCVARLCYDLGWVCNKEFCIMLKRTGNKVNVIVNSDDVSVDMGKAKIKERSFLKYNKERIGYVNVSMGNPHAVVEWNDLDSLEIDKIGKYMETHKNFPNRTNVEFFKLMDRSNIRFRVWERGSAETKACGSGACAVFAAVYEQKRCNKKVNMHMNGGVAQVEMSASGTIYLTGPANYVTKGKRSF